MLNAAGEIYKDFVLYNYLGIGLDAKYCAEFDDLRRNYPQLFFSQFSNKLIYSQMGAFDLIKRRISNTHEQLQSQIELWIDGVKVDLKGLENVIIMNIQSWGGGVQPWKDKALFKPQSFSDRLFEVFGIENVLHMGQVQLGLDEVVYLGQGRELAFSMAQHQKLHFHIDGEPHRLHGPCSLRLQHLDCVPFLEGGSEDEDEVEDWQQRVSRELTRARDDQLIDEQQREALLARLVRRRASELS